MDPLLDGRSVLICEDENLIALDVASEFGETGATLVLAASVASALAALATTTFGVAIVDHRLGDGDCSPVCDKLLSLDVPFIVYTGWGETVDGPCGKGVTVQKPAMPGTIIEKVRELLRTRGGVESV